MSVHFLLMHMSITMTVSLIGNLFLVFVIFRGNSVARRRLSPVQLLLLHTCAADFLFALLSLGLEIWLINTQWPYFSGPDILCRTVHFVQAIPLYASPFLLVAISADRYQAICRPLDNFRQSRYRRPNCLAAIAWTLSLLLSAPQLFIWRLMGEAPKARCGTIYGQNAAFMKDFYVVYFSVLAWLLPTLLAAFFYYKVCKAVWMSHRPESGIVECNGNTEEKSSFITQSYIDRLRKGSCGHRRQNNEFDRKRTQTVRLTMTIIACNFFLWAPFCIINFFQAFVPNLIDPWTISIVSIFGNLNSCVNPWIYILFNRKHVTRALCGRRSADGDSHQCYTNALPHTDARHGPRPSSSSLGLLLLACLPPSIRQTPAVQPKRPFRPGSASNSLRTNTTTIMTTMTTTRMGSRSGHETGTLPSSTAKRECGPSHVKASRHHDMHQATDYLMLPEATKLIRSQSSPITHRTSSAYFTALTTGLPYPSNGYVTLLQDPSASPDSGTGYCNGVARDFV